jgi:hypothetical protein
MLCLLRRTSTECRARSLYTHCSWLGRSLSDGGARQEGPVRGGANDLYSRTAGRMKQDVHFRHAFNYNEKEHELSSLTLPR